MSGLSLAAQNCCRSKGKLQLPPKPRTLSHYLDNISGRVFGELSYHVVLYTQIYPYVCIKSPLSPHYLPIISAYIERYRHGNCQELLGGVATVLELSPVQTNSH